MPATPTAPLGVGRRQQTAHVLPRIASDVLAEALGDAHAADVETRRATSLPTSELGRAAADVDDERAGLDRADAADGQLGLLLAA